jgi:thioredoxin-like negative regulator of GroEL
VKQFLRINTLLPENARFVRDFGIQATPTLIFMKDGKEVRRWVGLWVHPSQSTINFLEGLP